MNKKGDVPMVLLFFIAIFFCVVALFAFYSFNGDFLGKSQAHSELAMEAGFNQRYVVSKTELLFSSAILCVPEIYVEICNEPDLKSRFKKIAEKEDLRLKNSGNLFGKIRNGEFTLVEEEGVYVLKVEGLFVKSERGKSSIIRNFNLEIKMDKDGKLQSDKVYK